MTSHFLLLAVALFQEAPAGTLTLNGGERVTRVTTLRAEVRVVSPGAGNLEMSVSVDDKAPVAWSPYREVAVLDLLAGDGLKKVVLRLRDRLGKESSPVEAVIRLDTTPPVAKVEAPERVAGSDVRVAFDVPDAVAVQYTEDPKTWMAWEPYVTPKTIPLSKGPGAKVVFFRFRDEAGNESVPGRIIVEAQASAPVPPASKGIRSLAVGVRKSSQGALELTAWVDGAGLKEMRAEVDGIELLSRRPFDPSWTQDIAPQPGPRRLTVTAWEESGTEHRAEGVFLDGSATAAQESSESAREHLPLRVGLLAGVLPMGVEFDSLTPKGNRKIKPGTMSLVRLEGSASPVEPLYLQAAFEWAEGSDARLLSAGADVGVRFPTAKWDDVDLELGIEAGVYYSKLDVNVSDFGGFRARPVFRVGGTLSARFSEHLSGEFMVDYRFARYRFDEPVLVGDDTADGSGIGVMLGLSWRF